MKKGKMLLYILIGMMFFGFSGNAKAVSNEIIADLVCEYEVTSGEFFDSSQKSKYQNNGLIKFLYSDIILDYAKPETPFILRGIDTKNDVSVTGYYANSPFDKAGANMYKTFTETIIKVMSDRASNFDVTIPVCPKYLLKVKNGDGTNILFSQETSEYQKENSIISLATLNYEGLETIFPYEKKWKMSWEADGSNTTSDGLNILLHINKDAKLNAGVTYDKNSKFSKKQRAGGIPERWAHVEVPSLFTDDMGPLAKQVSYSLVIKDTFSPFVIDGRFGHLELVMLYNGEASVGNNKALWVENFTQIQQIEIGNCIGTTDTDVSDLYEFEGNILTYESALEQMAKLFLESGYKEGNISPIDLSNYSKAQLLKVNQDAYELATNNALSIETPTEFFEKASDYHDGYTKAFKKAVSKNLCKVVYDDLSRRYHEYEPNTSKMKNIVDAIKDNYENLENYATQKGANSDELKLIHEMQGALSNYSDDLQKAIESIREVPSFIGSVSLNFSTSGCGLMTSGLADWIQQAMNITKICALMLALILGMVDFFRGMASGSADTMKKVWTNFSRRLIVVVILFLLPVILEFILGLVNINGVVADNPLCGLK